MSRQRSGVHMSKDQSIDSRPSLWPVRAHCPISFPLVSEIESTTERFVGIESRCTDANLNRCNRQAQSPLFSIPAELRSLIYDYTSMPDTDPSTMKEGPGCIDMLGCGSVWAANLSWLQTCRLLWLEANAIVFKYTEPVFYRLYTRPDLYHFVRNLTPLNTEHLQRIHVGQEVFSLDLDDTILKYLEETKLQSWPPEVTITLTAYPCFASTEDVGDWMMQILTHQKLILTSKLQIIVHVNEAQVTDIRCMMEALRRERRIGDWEPRPDNGDHAASWSREWGDIRPRHRHGTNRVDMTYRTCKIDFGRAQGTEIARFSRFEPDMEADCWHVTPWRVLFPRRHSSEPESSTQARGTRLYFEKWQEQSSLLKFLD
ncbi:hypothetical protein DOTSEDRAFT_28075 [Dothistroma septosporum NZE10]|uniref:F-box domain-containing protein n=1 Tax=Dothistroma septosporum (strain NZE10 / CBS 128990) TaxID=675120 RepID=N1PDJ3_DOTSN|nr:hypothetical protein DOTSEDRAFT_28075 [Dothistroma septosporum NZE10]